MDEFFDYLFDQMPKGQRYSGGHCEAWYPEKVAKILEQKGFDTSIRAHKESRILDPKLVPERFFYERDYLSFKISAIKKSS